MGKTVRTHDDDEDFGEDFHVVEFKPKHEKLLKISKTAKARKADKWDRADKSISTKPDNYVIEE